MVVYFLRYSALAVVGPETRVFPPPLRVPRAEAVSPSPQSARSRVVKVGFCTGFFDDMALAARRCADLLEHGLALAGLLLDTHFLPVDGPYTTGRDAPSCSDADGVSHVVASLCPTRKPGSRFLASPSTPPAPPHSVLCTTTIAARSAQNTKTPTAQLAMPHLVSMAWQCHPRHMPLIHCRPIVLAGRINGPRTIHNPAS